VERWGKKKGDGKERTLVGAREEKTKSEMDGSGALGRQEEDLTRGDKGRKGNVYLGQFVREKEFLGKAHERAWGCEKEI